MLRKLSVVILGSILLNSTSCGPAPTSNAAVLEGQWRTSAAAGGSAVVTMDNTGAVVEIVATTADNVMATLTVNRASSTLEGSAVTMTIPTPNGEVVFQGTLSADHNTLTGTLTREIVVGNAMITIPQGNITMTRIVTCGGVTCDAGETCVNNQCVAADPCEGVTCDTGETCVNGQCVANDPCEGVTCDTGETCVNGQCVANDPCEGVTCQTCEACSNGTCAPLVGDAAAGETFFGANGCAGCHGPNANDGFAPSLVGKSCDLIFSKLSGATAHAGGTFPDATEQDAADLAAWLATL